MKISNFFDLFKSKNKFDPQDINTYIPKKEIEKLKLLNIRPKKVITVNSSKLFYQYRWEWPGVFSRDEGPFSIPEGPIKKLYKEYLTSGEIILQEEKLFKTDYYYAWNKIRNISWRFDWYNYPQKIEKKLTDQDIVNKAKKAIILFNSIKKNGYLDTDHQSNFITVLPYQFVEKKFNKGQKINGYELWSGHHRASALDALGIKEIKVILLGM